MADSTLSNLTSLTLPSQATDLLLVGRGTARPNKVAMSDALNSAALAATTAAYGVVLLAPNGGTTAGTVVQANDSRLTGGGGGGVTSLTGTANQISVSAATGAVTLSLPSTLILPGTLTGSTITGPATTDLSLAGGSTGATFVLGQGANGGLIGTVVGTGEFDISKYGSNARAKFQFDSTDPTGTVSGTMLRTIGLFAEATAGASYMGHTGTGATLIANTRNSTTLGNIDFATNVSGTTAVRARLTNGSNLLIGGTTDIAGSSGLKVFGNTDSSSTITGALQVVGGAGIAKALTLGGQLNGYGTAAALNHQIYIYNQLASATNAALSGARFIAQPGYSTFVGTTANGTSASYQSSILGNAVVQEQGYVISDAANGLLLHGINNGIRFATNNPGAQVGSISNAGVWNISTSTNSTAYNSGALVVNGGVGIGGALFSQQNSNAIVTGTNFANTNTGTAATLRHTLTAGTNTSTIEAYSNGHATFPGRLRFGTPNGQMDFVPSGVNTLSLSASALTSYVKVVSSNSSQANDTPAPYFQSIAGADATLGPLSFVLGSYVSATAGSRYGYIAVGDNGDMRTLSLNDNAAGAYGRVLIKSTTNSSSKITGALVIGDGTNGGLGVSHTVHAGQKVVCNGEASGMTTGDISASRVSNEGALFLGTDGAGYVYRAGGSITLRCGNNDSSIQIGSTGAAYLHTIRTATAGGAIQLKGDPATGNRWLSLGHIDNAASYTEGIRIDSNAQVSVVTNLTGSGTIIANAASNAFRITNSETPASQTASGTQGQITWDASYLYVCTSTNNWGRSSLNWAGGGGGSSAQVDTYTTTGTVHTWTKPAGAKVVTIISNGGGGQGGGGCLAALAAANPNGGGGGGGGAMNIKTFNAANLPSSLYVVVGVGGSTGGQGASGTIPAVGTAGQAGGNSTVATNNTNPPTSGILIFAGGGGGGKGGADVTTSVGGGGGGTGSAGTTGAGTSTVAGGGGIGGAGAAGFGNGGGSPAEWGGGGGQGHGATNNNNFTASGSLHGGGGGGGGGGGNARNGADGAASGIWGSGGGGAGSAAGNGGAGADAGTLYSSGAGGGGAGRITLNVAGSGFSGGAGGFPSGGGGGGGFGRDTGNTGGTGGAGGAGRVIIITYF